MNYSERELHGRRYSTCTYAIPAYNVHVQRSGYEERRQTSGVVGGNSGGSNDNGYKNGKIKKEQIVSKQEHMS